MNEIRFLTARELVQHYRDRLLSPVEVMHEVLESIAGLDPVVNCLCAVDGTQALAAARGSERRWKRGSPCGPLDGVPVSVKDLVSVRGQPTRYGSVTSSPEPESADAPAVARLRSAGALLFAKNTTSEFGNKIVTDSPLTGSTRNAWDTDLSSGGSSGGSAVAVAAGFGPLSLGTDGGGSIRIPSCWNGVVGFKPSVGLVPAGAAGTYTALSTLGPIARTAADAALMMDALTTPTAGERPGTGAIDFLSGADERLAGLRIAACLAPAGMAVESSIGDCVRRALTVLRELGAHVEEVTLAPLSEYARSGLHSLQWSVFFAHRVRQMSPLQQAMLDPDLIALARAGEGVDGITFAGALAARHQLTLAMAQFFGRYDLLVTPTFHVGPPPVPGLPPSLRCAPVLTSWCNQTGQPAVSVPCGMMDTGLPTGMQIVGPCGADARVLRAARAYEAARGPFPLSPLVRAVSPDEPEVFR